MDGLIPDPPPTSFKFTEYTELTEYTGSDFLNTGSLFLLVVSLGWRFWSVKYLCNFFCIYQVFTEYTEHNEHTKYTEYTEYTEYTAHVTSDMLVLFI